LASIRSRASWSNSSVEANTCQVGRDTSAAPSALRTPRPFDPNTAATEGDPAGLGAVTDRGPVRLMAALGTDQPIDILSKHDLQHLEASSNGQGEEALAGGAGQLGQRDRDPFGQDKLGSGRQGRVRILRHVAVPFWSSFLADARHLPHGRHQAGTPTSSSTNSGTTSERPTTPIVQPAPDSRSAPSAHPSRRRSPTHARAGPWGASGPRGDVLRLAFPGQVFSAALQQPARLHRQPRRLDQPSTAPDRQGPTDGRPPATAPTAVALDGAGADPPVAGQGVPARPAGPPPR
jgi:hypothetical protein